ncbi:MAG: hypothetical protein V4677_17645 [Bacteroidota bacterium]
MNKKVSIAFLVSLFLYLIYVETSVSYGLFYPDEYLFLFPVFVLLLLSLVISIIVSLVTRTSAWKIPATILLVMFFGVGTGRLVCSFQNQHTVESMDNVIKAIERCAKEQKAYPDSLDQLMPKWIDEIPGCYCGFKKLKFLYHKNSTTSYGECVRLEVYDRRHIAYRIYDNCISGNKARITYWDWFNH